MNAAIQVDATMSENQNREENTFFITCPLGVEEILREELAGAGFSFENLTIRSSGVKVSAPLEKILRAIFHLRSADRVYLLLDSQSLEGQEDLYQKFFPFNWKQFSLDKKTFKIYTAFGPHSQKTFVNSLFCSQKLKDAIVDSYQQQGLKRPNVDTKYPQMEFFLYIEKEAIDYRGFLYLDLVGYPLHQRGYRLKQSIAPIKENLAAAMILGFKEKLVSQSLPFVDLMCGQATFLIEAALIKYSLPPTYLKILSYNHKNIRHWSFLHHSWFLENKQLSKEIRAYIESLCLEIKQKLKSFTSQKRDVEFFGLDISSYAIKLAQENIQMACLSSLISVSVGDALKYTPSKKDQGIVFCNPPYGNRLGQEEDLDSFYFDLGEHLKHSFKNYTAYILTSKADLRKKISLRTKSRKQFFNGKIEVRLLEYELF